MFPGFHPSTQRQAECPTSPDKHTETATTPLGALFSSQGEAGSQSFGGEGALSWASRCTELWDFKDRAPRS